MSPNLRWMAFDAGGLSLGERIAGRIADGGPLPVSEYVGACLYDPDEGFYMRSGRAGGRAGHFLTAPEVGPLFGAVLARALDAWWMAMGEPQPFTVVDWGAGPGTLARAVLAARPVCLSAGALRWVAVELSPTQRALHPQHPLVSSVAQLSDGVAESRGAGVVVANELLDNLPFDIVRRRKDGWEELRVTADTAASGRVCTSGPSFSLSAATASSGLVEGLPDVAVGARLPVQRTARRWVAEALELFDAGRVVVFDYGADSAELAQRAPTADEPAAGLGWLRTHRSHRGGEWLSEPGSCDITADVALDQVQADHPAEHCTQAHFLQKYGIDELVAEGRASWAERAHVGDLAAVRSRSRASEAEALLDPDGMGSFNVLLWTVGQLPGARCSSRLRSDCSGRSRG